MVQVEEEVKGAVLRVNGREAVRLNFSLSSLGLLVGSLSGAEKRQHKELEGG